MADSYDVVVIGAGPGGYVAAIRCAQLGLKTACIDAWSNAKGEVSPGGTCLNVGCIPSKALLHASAVYHKAAHEYAAVGVECGDLKINVGGMLKHKESVVSKLTGGVKALLKANKVTLLHGHGQLGAGRKVTVSDAKGKATHQLQAQHVILASGSVPVEIPAFPYDGKYIVDNDGALSFDHVPGKFGVIGAGVIGLELGSVWNRLGSEVIVLEALDTFLGAADKDIARAAAREFKKQGLDIHLGARVTGAKVSRGKVKVSYEDKNGAHEITVDRLLVAVGRRPFTEGLLAADSGVELSDRGQIVVDGDCKTSAENVWGVGDAVRGPMLAHKASEEGVAVAERIASGVGHMNLDTVPWVIYTEPEIAWVGKTEQELKADGIDYRAGSFPFAANGRALGMNDAVGLVKILADANSDRILGAHLIGPNVSELVSELVVAMEFAASSEDIARIIHAHPTLSEAVHEAALAVDKRAIHRA